MKDRQDPEQGVRAAVEALGVPYEWLLCDPDFADTAVFCEKYGFPPENTTNTIIIASRRDPIQYVACVIQASVQLDANHAVRKLMGVRRLSFATAEQTGDLTGMAMGGVTPFNLPAEVPLYVDELVMSLDYVILGAGSRSAKIKISPAVFDAMPNAQIVPGLSRPRKAPMSSPPPE